MNPADDTTASERIYGPVGSTVVPATPDADETTAGEREGCICGEAHCRRCGLSAGAAKAGVLCDPPHAGSHDSATPDADDTPPPAAGGVEALADTLYRARQSRTVNDTVPERLDAEAVLASDWLKAHDAARDAVAKAEACTKIARALIAERDARVLHSSSWLAFDDAARIAREQARP